MRVNAGGSPPGSTKKRYEKVVLVHGYTSSPSKQRYQIIAEELNRLGIEYAIPALPGDEDPQAKEWLETINREIKNTNLPIVLVGHSLGTRAILLYLDQYNVVVDTVIPIATFNNDIETNRDRKDQHYASFFEYKLDIKKIKNLANHFIVIHSKDDDTIDYQQAVDISKELGARLITYNHAGHFSGKENATDNANIFLEAIKSAIS